MTTARQRIGWGAEVSPAGGHSLSNRSLPSRRPFVPSRLEVSIITPADPVPARRVCAAGTTTGLGPYAQRGDLQLLREYSYDIRDPPGVRVLIPGRAPRMAVQMHTKNGGRSRLKEGAAMSNSCRYDAAGCQSSWRPLASVSLLTSSRCNRCCLQEVPVRALVGGIGHYVPDNLVTTADVEKRLRDNGFPIPEGLVQLLTGVRSRYYAADEQASSDLAVEAGRRALDAAGLEHRRGP